MTEGFAGAAENFTQRFGKNQNDDPSGGEHGNGENRGGFQSIHHPVIVPCAVVIADDGLDGGGNADGGQQEKQADADGDADGCLGHIGGSGFRRGKQGQTAQQNGLRNATGELLEEGGEA